MKVQDLTKEQVLEMVGKGAASISEVARRLGLCRDKLDGKTSKRIRSLVPGLDEMLKFNKEKPAPASTEKEPAPTELGKDSLNEEMADDNPYRPGSAYATIFDVGSKGFLTKADLITKAAASTGKSPQCITFSLTVLTNKKHSSNGGRSTVLWEGDKMKLIALRRD
jgi:hypothetical protein